MTRTPDTPRIDPREAEAEEAPDQLAINTNEEDGTVTLLFSEPTERLTLPKDTAEALASELLNHARGHK